MKMKLGTAIRVIVSVSALGLIVWLMRDKLGQAFVILQNEVNLPMFLIAAGVYFLSIVVLSLRMQTMSLMRLAGTGSRATTIGP